MSAALLLAMACGTLISSILAARAARLNVELTRRGNDLTRRGVDLEKSLAGANLNLAMFNFERGSTACKRGEIGTGLLRMVECWRSAEAAGPDGETWRRVARDNITSWQRHQPPSRRSLSGESLISSVAFSPDGKRLVTGCFFNKAQIWDVASGAPAGPPLAVKSAVPHRGLLPHRKGGHDRVHRRHGAALGRRDRSPPSGRP